MIIKKLLPAVIAATVFAASPAWSAHGVAQYGAPKYPADFTHFDYVNPAAPKGGSLALSSVAANSSFDKLNPFTLKGVAAPGLLELVFETLTVTSLDEPNTQYGLLADDIQVAADFRSVTFHINPRARFSNGAPVQAADVKYSFDTLVNPKSSPRFKAYFAEIAKLTVVDPQTVRFDFKRRGRDLSFVAGSLPVFSSQWGVKLDGKPTPFDQLRLEPPVASGPYRIERAIPGRSVVYSRDPAYWGADIPTRKGGYNFDTVTYKLYKDRATQVAAIRALDYDLYPEEQMRYWCCQYIGKNFDNGTLVKEIMPHGNLAPMNGYAFNLRRERFKDVRVRAALNLAYDWEWLNDKIFDSQFERIESYFSNSALAAQGLPGPAELALLEPWRAQLDPAVFGPMLRQPTTRSAGNVRDNLAKALELFEQAGWRHRDGVLVNDKGEPFTLEVQGIANNMLLEPYYLNLKKLGVVLNRRAADGASDRARMRKFDFDFTAISYRKGRDPGPELWRNLNSADADTPGSDNIPGVKSPVVDALIKAFLEAESEESMQTAAHALDRVLMHNHYALPWRYLKNYYFIFNKKLQRPPVIPKFYGPYEWVFTAWWSNAVPLMK